MAHQQVETLSLHNGRVFSTQARLVVTVQLIQTAKTHTVKGRDISYRLIPFLISLPRENIRWRLMRGLFRAQTAGSIFQCILRRQKLGF